MFLKGLVRGGAEVLEEMTIPASPTTSRHRCPTAASTLTRAREGSTSSW